jgi:CheY-like chemotaxis protein
MSDEGGEVVFRCVNCSFKVHTGNQAPTRSAAEPPPPPVIAAGRYRSVVIADDSSTMRMLLQRALEKAGLGQDIRVCDNGEQFVEAVAEKLSTGSVMDLVILDVEMPVLNGYCAGIVFRAMERAYKLAPAPILFFSSRVCDETFKKALQHCAPALYLNKGVGASLEQMAARVTAMLASVSSRA